ncbi:conserved Plasmodium protein, unknown function [Plasmodium knowlesi strain H]|uniref:Uncharacterized protein n=3 Tax=Plasmodium knowlesi TaxID=5850 RepID=A0A5K1UYE8_PLAKH|nr:WD repeat-containing protein, putative [Plasmodium knowlesi strain H]OTN67728.1 Uncharacterized protein PKNOH_S05391800 [Plasmodium knowlesi]CAA9990505.1 WD repeat-containing protein, putative [Plasmodium knowlesi strain H]SBO19737.1 conserved Plasmodium protein, unknown function [Plasmodium knowlesi strain H]SBO22458.1 conserved Plasmodium protein, unknown function [Plasmodium knowlesi strain H]VVS79979.1 WD repeat-containing protein, putative [Plasmodium knowlesi strain H]|eukprot:XP_002260895.1 hypothetical protein, conserved in Plasmodium species [Plasmodium knowlesi strain H]
MLPMGKTYRGRSCTPWKNVKTLKNCDVNLLFCHDLSKSVKHKFVYFALNLLCVSKKYELVFIAYGQYIYVYELKNFLENNININVDVSPNIALGQRKENGRDNTISSFYKQEISQNDNSFKNINKIKYVHDEVKNDLTLKSMSIPAPILILSPHVYSKGYVNIKCEEKDNTDKCILISVGWSEDTNVYYVEKIVECINIKKKLKHILEKKLFDLKRYEENETKEAIFFNDTNAQCGDSALPTMFMDSYRFLNKLKIDENDFILSLIHKNQHPNGYSKELIEMFELSKCINSFDHIRNKTKQRRSARLYKMQLKKERRINRRKKNLNNRELNRHVTANLKNPLLKTKKINVCKKEFYRKCVFERESLGGVSGATLGGADEGRNRGTLTVYKKKPFKKGPYRMKCICILRCPREGSMTDPKSGNTQNANTRSNNKGKRKKFKISEIYSSLESAEEDAYDTEDGREDGFLHPNDNLLMKKKKLGRKFKNNHQVNYLLGDDAKEIEELNFYKKMRNNVYMGYNQRNNHMGLNEQNEYINAVRDESEFVNTYIKSSSDEECTAHLSSKMRITSCRRKESGPKFYRHGDLRMTLRRGLHMAQLMSKRNIKKVERNKKRVRDDDNTDTRSFSNVGHCEGGEIGSLSPNAPHRGRAKIVIKRRKKYHGNTKKTQIERLRRNIQKYNLHVEKLNILKKERKKFVNFCKLYITHEHYEEFSNKLENFLDPSVDIKYNKIWQQFNIFSFNLFNVDYNDKILKSSHIYVQPDIVFSNKTYIKSDTSTWAISFNFTKNLLAIGSNTHNINLYNLNNFYYFRRRYDYDDALNFFKNAFVHKKIKVNRLFVNDEKDPFYFDSTDGEDHDDNIGKKRKSKKRHKKRKRRKDSTEGKVHIKENKKKNNPFSHYHQSREGNCYNFLRLDHCGESEESSTSVSISRQMNRKGGKRNQPKDSPSSKLKKKKKEKKNKKKNDSVTSRNEYIDRKKRTSSGTPPPNHVWEEKAGQKGGSITDGEEEFIRFFSSEDVPFVQRKDDSLLHLQNSEDTSACAADKVGRNYNNPDGKNKGDPYMIPTTHQSKDPMRGFFPKKNNSYVTKISAKDHFKEANLHKVVSSILHRRSYIPIDLAQVFLNRKENLKKMLLTLSYNFPSDAIILFLKQASIGAEIYHMKWNIHNNIALTVHKMKKIYARRLGSTYCLNLKLFHPKMVIINNNRYLKNWYIKFLRRSMPRSGVRVAEIFNRMSKRRKKWRRNCARVDHGEKRHNYLDILKDREVGERHLHGGRSVEGPLTQHTRSEDIEAAKGTPGEESTTSEDELGVHNVIYRKVKSCNMSKVERIYVLGDRPSTLEEGENGRMVDTNVDVKKDKVIKCYKHMYSYKKANNVLKNISRRFRKFIKERHNFRFSPTKRLFSNENSIFVVLDKRRNKGELHCYDKFAGKYVDELKMVVKSIQRHSAPGLFLKPQEGITPTDAATEEAGTMFVAKGRTEGPKSSNGEGTSTIEQPTMEEEDNFDFYKKTVLVVCELKDHNNNTLDIIHLTNDPMGNGVGFLQEGQPGPVRKGCSDYYSVRFDEGGGVNRKKERTERNDDPISSSDESSRSGSNAPSSNAKKTEKKKRKKKKKQKRCLRNIMEGKTHMNGIVNYTVQMEMDNLYRSYRLNDDRKDEMKVKSVMNNLLLNVEAESGSNSSESANISEGSINSRGINFPAYININTTSQNTMNFNRFINGDLLSTSRSRLIGNGYNSDVSNNGLLIRALQNYRMVRNNFLRNMRNNIRNSRSNRPSRANRLSARNVQSVRDDIMNENTHAVISNMVNAAQNILNINNSIGIITGRPPLAIRGRGGYYMSRTAPPQTSILRNNEHLPNLENPNTVDPDSFVAAPNEDSELGDRSNLEDSQVDNETSSAGAHSPREDIEETGREGRETQINSYASIIIRNLLSPNPDRIEETGDAWRFRINTSNLNNIYLISRTSPNNRTSSLYNNGDGRNSRNSTEIRQQNEHPFLNMLYNNILNMTESNRNNSSSLDSNMGNWTSNLMNNLQNDMHNINEEYNPRRNLRSTFFNQLNSFSGESSPTILDLMNTKKSESVKIEGKEGTLQCRRFREIPFGVKYTSMNEKYDAIVRYVYTLPKSADEIMLTHGSGSDSFFDFVIVYEGVCEENERLDRDDPAQGGDEDGIKPPWGMDGLQEVDPNVEDALAAGSDQVHAALEEERSEEETDEMTQEEDNDDNGDDEEEGEADESADESAEESAEESADETAEGVMEEATSDLANGQMDHHDNAEGSANEEPLEGSHTSTSHTNESSQWPILEHSLGKDSITGHVHPGSMAIECIERDTPWKEEEEDSQKISNRCNHGVTDVKRNLSSASTLDIENSSYDSYYSSSSNTASDFTNISEYLVDECSECENADLCFEGSNIINFNAAYRFLKYESSKLYINNCSVSIEKNREGRLSKYYLKREVGHPASQSDYQGDRGQNGRTQIVPIGINDFENSSSYVSKKKGAIWDEEEYAPLWMKKCEKDTSTWKEKSCKDKIIITSKWLHKILLQQNYYLNEEKREKLEMILKGKKTMEGEMKRGEKDDTPEQTNQATQKKKKKKKHAQQDERVKEKIEYLNLSGEDEKNDSDKNSVVQKDRFFNTFLRYYYSTIKKGKGGKKKKKKKKKYTGCGSQIERKYYDYNVSALVQYKAEEVRNSIYNDKNANYIFKKLPNNVITRKFCNKVRMSPSYDEPNRINEVLWTFSNVTFYSADWYDIMYKLFFELSSRFYEIIIKHHKHNIPCVKFSPDDNFLLSCSVDRTMVLWNPFNVKNYDLDRNYNIYDHVFPPRKDRKSRAHHHNMSIVRENIRRKSKRRNNYNRMPLSLVANATVQINYGRKRSAFEKVFHESKMYKAIREKELLSNMKKNNILCKREMKHMGWSCDFLLKKNISKCDILTDLFYKEKFFVGHRPSFNYGAYFPSGNVHMDNFCPFFQKYSFFQLFSCSILSAQGIREGSHLHFLRSYLYKRNMKRTKYVQTNNIETIVEMMTNKNFKRTSFSKKQIKQIYSTMKYVCRNLLKSYIVVYPLRYEERKCDLGSVKLTRRRLKRDVCVLTDYEYGDYANIITSAWNDEHAMPGCAEDLYIKPSRKMKDKTKRKYYTRRQNKRKSKKQKEESSLIESESNNESDDTWETDQHSSSSCVEPDKKNWKCANSSDYDEDNDELDADYKKMKKHKKSLFYKYIRGIRNDFSFHFLSGKRKSCEDNPKKWIPLFEKLIHQYADLKFCKSMYRHVKCKVLSDCIAKFEASKPRLYFNFHITANYQESKILNELLQNYAVYFGSMGSTDGTSGETNPNFQAYLTLIKRKGTLRWGSWKKQGETEEDTPEMHSKNVGYTIILKNNVSNFHNVINNIVNISHNNRIINHHKYFRENNMYKTDRGGTFHKVHTGEEGMEDGREEECRESAKYDATYEPRKKRLENFFDDLESDTTHFCSSDSLNSDRNSGKRKKGKMNRPKMKRNERGGDRNGCAPRKKDLEDVLRREDKVYNICFLHSRNDNYQIKYFENINVLQNMYRYCGRGLLVVNIKYVTDENPEDANYNGERNPMVDDQNKCGSVIFQTDIHICSEKKPKRRKKDEVEKEVHYKKAKTIIFIIRVNLHELRNYQMRKIIFEEKYVKSTYYINLQVMKIFYQIALKNCKLLHKSENEEHDKKVNAEKKRILKSFYAKEKYSFLVYLTKNLFQKRKKYPLTPRRICKYIVLIRNIILDTRLFDHYENCNSDLPQVQADYRFLYSLNLDLPKRTTLFKLFFLLLPKGKRDTLMLNIALLRFLYSHLSRGWEKRSTHFTYGEKSVRREKIKKKNCACVKKTEAKFHSVVDREEKKQLSHYIVICADKYNLYLSKIKFTKITKNFFNTRFVPILELSKPVEPKLPSAYKSSRINLLKIIYDKSCIVLANQYSNLIFVYFAHKCVYTNSYFLIPYFTIPLYTERIGRVLLPNFRKDACIGEKKRLVNNVNYNFRKILADNYVDMDEELNFFIAGLDVIYLKGKKNNFELTIFAILLNNILFCYKLNFQYY